MSNANSGTDAKPLECSACGGAGHYDTISGLDEGCETCGTCRGTGVERCAFCWDAPAVTQASWMGEAQVPSCRPCADICVAEGAAA